MKTQIFPLFIIFNFLSFINSKFPDNRTDSDLEVIYNQTFLRFSNESLKNYKNYKEKGQYYAFPNTIRMNTTGTLFMSVPRHLFGEEIDSTIPSSFNYLLNGILYPWPNIDENDYEKGQINSVVGFEIDLKGKIYLLNHRKDNLCELLIYNRKGNQISKIDLSNVTIHKQHRALLSNIVIDINNNYAFISDTGKIFKENFTENDDITNTKSSIIVVNLDKNRNILPFKLIQKHDSTQPKGEHDLYFRSNYNHKISNIGLYGLALSCDKNTLYYSPLRSDCLYSVKTAKLRNELVTTEQDIQYYKKNVSSFELLSSARGLFYYTSVEDNSVLVNFYERKLSFQNIRAAGHNRSAENYSMFLDEIPISITFNGTTGFLYYLVNKHHIFIDDNINKKLKDNQGNFIIYKVKTNDRNYLYNCNVYSHLQNSIWFLILPVAFCFSWGFIILTKHIAAISPNPKSLYQQHEEELAYLDEHGMNKNDNIDNIDNIDNYNDDKNDIF